MSAVVEPEALERTYVNPFIGRAPTTLELFEAMQLEGNTVNDDPRMKRSTFISRMRRRCRAIGGYYADRVAAMGFVDTAEKRVLRRLMRASRTSQERAEIVAFAYEYYKEPRDVYDAEAGVVVRKERVTRLEYYGQFATEHQLAGYLLYDFHQVDKVNHTEEDYISREDSFETIAELLKEKAVDSGFTELQILDFWQTYGTVFVVHPEPRYN